MMTITVMALAWRLQNRTFSVSISTEVLEWQVQNNTNPHAQILKKVQYTLTKHSWQTALYPDPRPVFEDSKEARVWRLGLWKQSGEEAFRATVGASCMTPHFAVFDGWNSTSEPRGQKTMVRSSDLAHIYGRFGTTKKSWAVSTVTGLQSLKYLSCWSLQKKFADPYSNDKLGERNTVLRGTWEILKCVCSVPCVWET